MYYLSGKALCSIQILEDALSHSIALKKDVKTPDNMSREEANAFLTKYRKLSLGQAIKNASDGSIFSKTILESLRAFLDERNWLVHHCLIQFIDDFDNPKTRNALFQKIDHISNRANSLQREIEYDLIQYSKERGVETSKAEEAI